MDIFKIQSMSIPLHTAPEIIKILNLNKTMFSNLKSSATYIKILLT